MWCSFLLYRYSVWNISFPCLSKFLTKISATRTTKDCRYPYESSEHPMVNTDSFFVGSHIMYLISWSVNCTLKTLGNVTICKTHSRKWSKGEPCHRHSVMSVCVLSSLRRYLLPMQAIILRNGFLKQNKPKFEWHWPFSPVTALCTMKHNVSNTIIKMSGRNQHRNLVDRYQCFKWTC
jgi:hypothetical protein